MSIHSTPRYHATGGPGHDANVVGKGGELFFDPSQAKGCPVGSRDSAATGRHDNQLTVAGPRVQPSLENLRVIEPPRRQVGNMDGDRKRLRVDPVGRDRVDLFSVPLGGLLSSSVDRCRVSRLPEIGIARLASHRQRFA